ncbi:unnamed protein product [uncultured bacterium]|nr:unnamed protein product [uncultured bacterium]
MRLVALAYLLACFVVVCRAEEKKLVELNSVRLYLPDDTLRQRIGNDSSPLADYIKSLQKEAALFWEKAEPPKAKGVLIAVGVKQDKKSRIWCDAVDGEISAEALAKMEKKLGEVPAIAVKKGPIAFAVEINLQGQKPEKFPEMPKAWVEAAKKSKEPLMFPDELFKIVWAD